VSYGEGGFGETVSKARMWVVLGVTVCSLGLSQGLLLACKKEAMVSEWRVKSYRSMKSSAL